MDVMMVPRNQRLDIVATRGLVIASLILQMRQLLVVILLRSSPLASLVQMMTAVMMNPTKTSKRRGFQEAMLILVEAGT